MQCYCYMSRCYSRLQCFNDVNGGTGRGDSLKGGGRQEGRSDWKKFYFNNSKTILLSQGPGVAWSDLENRPEEAVTTNQCSYILP